MSKSANHETWNCPLCIGGRLAYGTTCPDPQACGNPLNVNAGHYLNPDRSKKKQKKAEKGTGISEISNENKEA